MLSYNNNAKGKFLASYIFALQNLYNRAVAKHHKQSKYVTKIYTGRLVHYKLQRKKS